MENRTKGHLKSDTATTYLHDPVNELTKVDNTAYEYDAAGNLTKDGTYSYFWDYENRLTKVKLASDSSDVAEYTYDALGRRAEKIDHTGESAVTTRWYLDAWSAVEERDGDDALQATFINGARLDEYILMNRNSTNYWYMESPIVGNVVALVNSSGAIQEGCTYRAYGQATVHTGAGDDEAWFTSDDPTATSSSVGNPYLFTGRNWDSTISLQYSRARWYAPIPGRWLSRDPAEYEDGTNLYEYARSRPVDLLDTLGERPSGIAVRAGPVKGSERMDRLLPHTVLDYGGGSAGADWSPESKKYESFEDFKQKCGGITGCKGVVSTGTIRLRLKSNEGGGELQMKELGELQYGRRKGLCCAAATKGDIKSCIAGFGKAEYARTRFHWMSRNCYLFASQAAGACCLKGAFEDYWPAKNPWLSIWAYYWTAMTGPAEPPKGTPR